QVPREQYWLDQSLTNLRKISRKFVNRRSYVRLLQPANSFLFSELNAATSRVPRASSRSLGAVSPAASPLPSRGIATKGALNNVLRMSELGGIQRRSPILR